MVDLLGCITAPASRSSDSAMCLDDLVKLNAPRLAPSLQGVRGHFGPFMSTIGLTTQALRRGLILAVACGARLELDRRRASGPAPSSNASSSFFDLTRVLIFFTVRPLYSLHRISAPSSIFS